MLDAVDLGDGFSRLCACVVFVALARKRSMKRSCFSISALLAARPPGPAPASRSALLLVLGVVAGVADSTLRSRRSSTRVTTASRKSPSCVTSSMAPAVLGVLRRASRASSRRGGWWARRGAGSPGAERAPWRARCASASHRRSRRSSFWSSPGANPGRRARGRCVLRCGSRRARRTARRASPGCSMRLSRSPSPRSISARPLPARPRSARASGNASQSSSRSELASSRPASWRRYAESAATEAGGARPASWSPARRRRMVDLPPPFGPTSPTCSPSPDGEGGSTSTSTRRTTSRCFLRRSRSLQVMGPAAWPHVGHASARAGRRRAARYPRAARDEP